MLRDIPQTLTCSVCKSQIPFTLSGLLRGERLTCLGCSAVVSLSAESLNAVQSVVGALDHIQHHQPFTENELTSVGQQFIGIPWDELIGGSLNAKEKAETALAMYMDCYLKEHGLEGTYESFRIEMELELPQCDALNVDEISGGKKPSATFHIPLSAVIPTDSLGTETQPFSK